MILKNYRRSLNLSYIMLIYITVCNISPLIGCSGIRNIDQNKLCSNYPNFQSSQYILPYVTGDAYPVIQGNCSPEEYPWTHYGNLRFAYDFGMPIGTTIIAVRAGTVVFVRDNFTDNDHGKNQGNAIVILHEDGTYSLYAHITNKGSKVRVGQVVKQGETIALSGNSGETPTPHLHFQLNVCGDFTKCDSMPVSFRNARPSTNRLEQGVVYTAE
ncbi:MAG: M23 family metallopeptidase [Desulfamplus sp.]|nr:M23 family metallopeptidase [Desulfamplus sp.]